MIHISALASEIQLSFLRGLSLPDIVSFSQVRNDLVAQGILWLIA